MNGQVFATERPAQIHLDDQGRLHNESGPSILYRDGWAFYHVHGVAVSMRIVERPDTITLEEIEKERNAEVRRIMTERYGVGRYLQETGAELIEFELVPVDRKRGGRAIPRALLRDKHGNQYLEGTDGSTSRVYFMPVPREARTCAEAHTAIMPFGRDDKVAIQS